MTKKTRLQEKCRLLKRVKLKPPLAQDRRLEPLDEREPLPGYQLRAVPDKSTFPRFVKIPTKHVVVRDEYDPVESRMNYLREVETILRAICAAMEKFVVPEFYFFAGYPPDDEQRRRAKIRYEWTPNVNDPKSFVDAVRPLLQRFSMLTSMRQVPVLKVRIVFDPQSKFFTISHDRKELGADIQIKAKAAFRQMANDALPYEWPALPAPPAFEDEVKQFLDHGKVKEIMRQTGCGRVAFMPETFGFSPNPHQEALVQALSPVWAQLRDLATCRGRNPRLIALDCQINDFEPQIFE
jgi:hypothetical protein